MRRGKFPRHLSQKVPGGVFYATLEIPKDVRPWFANKPRFFASLKTDSMSVAERRKWEYVSYWKAQIASVRGGKGPLEQMRIDIAATEPGLDRYMLEEAHHSVAVDAAQEGKPEVLEAYNTVYNGWVRLEDVVPQWIKRKTEIDEIAAKTLYDYQAVVQAFIKRFKYLHDVNTKDVADWLDEGNRQFKRKKVMVAALKGFLKVAGAPDDILKDVIRLEDVPKSQRNKRRVDQRQHLEDADIAKLVKAATDKGDQQLADIIRLGAYTGARIEELCKLRVSDVTSDAFKIRNAKTDAGDRDIPIHSKITQLVARLLDESKDGYLVSGLSEDQNGRRSQALTQRFSRLKSSLGYDQRFVFHGLRKSFITKLERAGQQETIIARLVGHEIQSITLGLYSAGLSIQEMKGVVELVVYSPDV